MLKVIADGGVRFRVVKVVDFKPFDLAAVGSNLDGDFGFSHVRKLSS
jgi:hypothetical protein